MKRLIFTLSLLLLLMGCSSGYVKTAKNTQLLKKQKELKIEYVGVAYGTSNILGLDMKIEMGAKIKITNTSNKVLYLHWNESSMKYSEKMSRVSSGHIDKGSQPNVTLMPHSSIVTDIFPVDLINYDINSETSAISYNINPPLVNVLTFDLVLSYTDSNLSKMKQAYYRFNLNKVTKK